MRYVEGTDLRSLLQEQGELAPTRVAAIVRQIAAGLDAAHEEGLVHRDVKPGNVLIARARGTDAGEHVYLSDFGLTRRSTSESGVTGTGQFVGTLDYAAPEQFAGGTLDARTDVYSLGCVLYECLTGHPPFRAENDAGLMYAHLQADPPRATDDRPQLPKRIDTIVAMAMAKAPTARYQTAGALADEAVRALAPGEPSGPSGTQPGAIVRWLLPVAAVAVALIAGIVLSSVLRGDTPAEGDQGLPTSSASPSPSPTIAPLFRTIDRPLTSEEERLFSYVPEDVSSDCHPLDRDEPVQGEIAAIACRAEGVEVLYEAFPTRDLMDEAFQVNLNISGASPGECATDKVAVTPYTVDEQPAGRVLCYTTDVGQLTEGVPRRSHIEWTDENASIYAHVVRNDLGDLSLYEWWLSSAGPLIPGSGAGSGQKDRPDVVADRHLEDGVYLTSLSCGGFSNATCSLRIAGDRYEIAFTGDPGPIEIGTVLLRKPDLVLFAPETGECFDPEVPGEAPPTQPALFEWSVEGDELSFERTSGGRCAGPQGLTDDPWTRAPAGQLVVEAGDDLIVTDAAGEILTSLTDEAETIPNSWPDWSSDGSEVVFSGADAEGFDLYLVNGDGTGLTRLTDVEGDEVTPAWSPDGTKILYAFDGRSGPVVSGIEFVNPDGSGATQVFAGPEGGGIFQPLWSPDGTQIAFSLFTSAGPAPYVVDADGSDAAPITEDLGVPVGWTPEGQVIVFRDGALSAIAPDGSDESVYLAELPGGVTRPVLDRSPDGQWLAISDASTQGNGVFLVSADGSKVFAIGPGVEPDWRPPTG